MNQCPRSLLNQDAGGGGARAKMLFTAGGVLFAEGGFGAFTRAAAVAAQSRERASRAPAAKPRVRCARVDATHSLGTRFGGKLPAVNATKYFQTLIR